jgi:ABC-type multidrug transport system ATPase subunit
MREVGAVLDAKALHGGRRARDHLQCLAQSNGIPRSRVDEVLRIAGLEGVARRDSHPDHQHDQRINPCLAGCTARKAPR